MTNIQGFNKLKDETSAYLQQHNKNPITWYPYGPEALQKAKDENKPIFISIGYSTCHWCHVMEKETFSDPKIAKIVNENFISIKVDKEEIPDLDAYFQLASQILNGRGGWPLNAFTTPDFDPFFVGTYFGTTSQENLPSFHEVVSNLAIAYKEDFETILSNGVELRKALKQPPVVKDKVEFEGHFPGAAAILDALKTYQDDDNGGYGVAPKFPHYAFLEWATEHILEGMVPEELGKHIVLSTERILMGGIFDHARGGVHRYSTDKTWSVPHFEKMLYDQAGLLKLLAKTSLLYPAPLIFDATILTLDYLKTEMLSEKGYFFSGQDADSEGVEGLYFTFTWEEFQQAISDDQELIDSSDKLKKWFCLQEEGLNTIELNAKLKAELYEPSNWTLIRKTKTGLLNARKLRMPPLTDNKGVASWNFQLLTSLIDLIQYSKIDTIRNKAVELLKIASIGVSETFLYNNSKNETRIYTSTTRPDHPPQFEDYVFFAEYSLRCFEYSATNAFKINGLNTLKFIFKEFFKDDCFFTRSVNVEDNHLFDNIHTPIFDGAHKSALGTLIILLRKWSLVDSDIEELLNKTDKNLEVLTHLCLKNPLGFGESLRGLVYPTEAYRKIEVPKSWYDDGSFFEFFPNFSARFALCPVEQDDNSWQICTATECELKGSSFEEFRKVFKPQNTENKNE